MSPVTLITGSNGGIGHALSEYLLSKGERNIAFHFNSSSDKISDCLRRFDLDPDKHLFKANLCSESEVRVMREEIESRIGTVWGLVNVAGSSSNGMSWKLSLEDFKQVIDNNLTSTFLCCREFIPGMRTAGSGRILNFSSIVSHTGAVGASHYCAAKGAITSFTKAISLELASKNITANTITLGYFQYGLINHLSHELQESIKEKTPLRRFGTGAEVGAYVRLLLSEDGAFTTGQTLHINGGLY